MTSIFSNIGFHSSLSHVAGGKQDVLQLVGPTNQGLPAPDAMPFNHGDVSYIQRHHARER